MTTGVTALGGAAFFDAPDVVTSGPMPVALAVAVLAGVLSFVSPCILPLIPGYLGYLTGMSDLSLIERPRTRMALGALGFVVGFTAVFVVLFASFSALTRFLWGNQDQLIRIFGVLIIIWGGIFAGAFPGSTRRFALSWRPAAGVASAPLLGAIFALGWSPCVGPTLGAVLGLASGSGGGADRGIALAIAYGLGLGIPFIAAAVAWSRLTTVFSFLQRHRRVIQLCGALGLIVLGVLMVAGVWVRWMSWVSAAVIEWSVPL
ncbi:MAG: cytochrome c biogenesis CcdA family protein [Actinomycetota bacterium]